MPMTMAVLFSLVSSCQRHGHDPFVYLRDVRGFPLERVKQGWRELVRRLVPGPAPLTAEALGLEL